MTFAPLFFAVLLTTVPATFVLALIVMRIVVGRLNKKLLISALRFAIGMMCASATVMLIGAALNLGTGDSVDVPKESNSYMSVSGVPEVTKRDGYTSTITIDILGYDGKPSSLTCYVSESEIVVGAKSTAKIETFTRARPNPVTMSSFLNEREVKVCTFTITEDVAGSFYREAE